MKLERIGLFILLINLLFLFEACSGCSDTSSNDAGLDISATDHQKDTNIDDLQNDLQNNDLQDIVSDIQYDTALNDEGFDINYADIMNDSLVDIIDLENDFDSISDINDINIDVQPDNYIYDTISSDSGYDISADIPEQTYCDSFSGLSNLNLIKAIHEYLYTTYTPISGSNKYETARLYMFTTIEWYFSEEHNHGGLDCNYTGTFVEVSEGDIPENSVMNCEHTWPRSQMSQTNGLYALQESDIYNLYPTISNVNSSRSSYPFGEPVSGIQYYYNPLDKTQYAMRGEDQQGDIVFQPYKLRTGDVSRAMFYFSVRWGRNIPDNEEKTLRKWFYEDYVDAKEIRRNDLISKIQGNRNPFVDCPELLQRIDDFISFDILDQ